MKKIFLNTFVFILVIFCFQIKGQESVIDKLETFQKYVICDVSVFNGKDSTVFLNQDVFVSNSKIEKIVANSEADYSGYDTLNGSGKFIMPGLLDAHVHIQYNGSSPWAETKFIQQNILDAYLYCGITTVFDLGGLSSNTEKIKKKALKGTSLCPDIYHSHIAVTIPGSHPIPASQEVLPFPLNKLVDKVMPTVTSKKEAEKVVKRYVKKDVDYVKIICDQLPPGTPEMNFETLNWIIEEVHKHNFKAVVHVGSPKNALDAVKAKADVLAHGIFRGALTELEAQTIAESGIPIVYTLFAFEFTELLTHGDYFPDKFDSILVPQEILNGISGENGKKIETSHVVHSFASSLTSHKSSWKPNLDLLRKYNATIIVGTDAGAPGYYHGTSIYHEIDELIKYGMSNLEVLKAATYLSSFTYIDNPDFGMIKDGFQADILVLRGNPLKNIEYLKDPFYIINNGTVMQRSKKQ